MCLHKTDCLFVQSHLVYLQTHFQIAFVRTIGEFLLEDSGQDLEYISYCTRRNLDLLLYEGTVGYHVVHKPNLVTSPNLHFVLYAKEASYHSLTMAVSDSVKCSDLLSYGNHRFLVVDDGRAAVVVRLANILGLSDAGSCEHSTFVRSHEFVVEGSAYKWRKKLLYYQVLLVRKEAVEPAIENMSVQSVTFSS